MKKIKRKRIDLLPFIIQIILAAAAIAYILYLTNMLTQYKPSK